MVAYLDSSVVLRYILLGENTIQHVQEFPQVASSELLQIECRRVLLRCRMEGELTDEGLVQANDRLNDVLAGVDLVELTTRVKRRAAEAFPIHVKTLGALHISTALELRGKAEENSVSIFSCDRSLNLCARALGFQVALP